MRDLSRILNEEIYPALSPYIPELFPEFEFKQMRGGWQSTNKLKLNGMADGDSSGKV